MAEQRPWWAGAEPEQSSPSVPPRAVPWWSHPAQPPTQPPNEPQPPQRGTGWVKIAAASGVALLVGLGVGALARSGTGANDPNGTDAMIISEPGATVTVTAAPRPAPTVTVPGPRVTVTVTARAPRGNDNDDTDPPPEDDEPRKPKNDPKPDPEPEPRPPAPPEPEPGPEPAGSFPGNGMFVVNDEIEPGTYKSKPMPNGYVEICAWRRLKDTSGSRDSTIDGNIAQGPVTVTIKPSDGAFETRGCQEWKRAK